MTEILAMFAWSLVTVSIWMSGLWILYLVTRNASYVDIGWTLSFILTATISKILGNGYWLHSTLLVILVYLWAFRLASHLIIRILSTPREDPRYTAIKNGWGPDPRGFKFLGMFLLQGLLAVLLSIPFYLICANPSTTWHPAESLALLVWIAGFTGESAADNQLKNFKSNPLNRDKVCDVGLWAYSRHPNYFFEWIIWISYALLASSSPGGLLAWLAPITMLYLLLRVSGIPATEKQSLATKGDAYRAYQKTTSAFIPWPPKKTRFLEGSK